MNGAQGHVCVVPVPKNIVDLLAFLLLKTRGRPTGLGDLKCGVDFFPVFRFCLREPSGKRGKTGRACAC